MAHWRNFSLLQRFALAGGAVMLLAALIIGRFVAGRIEQGVVQNSAVSAALYMESFIAPLGQELAAADRLSPEAQQALHEVFDNSPLGDRIVSYKLWKKGGLVAHASDENLIGQRFDTSDDLRRAWNGQIAASFEATGDGDQDAESAAERAMGVPLLEIYSPIHAAWTGEVIAVAEFYEIATELEQALAENRRRSWLVVAATLSLSALALVGIVGAGSRTIAQQDRALRQRLEESRLLAHQNAELRRRAVSAASRAAAQAELRLRRVAADLHDGPGQNLSLAALRLDRILPDSPAAREEAATIRDALNTAMTEIRTISRGLSLPELERQSVTEVAERAVEAVSRQADAEIALSVDLAGQTPAIGHSGKIALFRFLQEALSNAVRHGGAPISAHVGLNGGGALKAEVADGGPGFDPAERVALRFDGGQGLAGLRDRIESLGGSFVIDSAPGRGSRIRMTLPPDGATGP